MNMNDISAAERIAAELAPEYLAVRVLPDASVVALGNLLYTRAIFMDCDRLGFGRRYCFADRALADAEFAKLTSSDDEPQGNIASRGRKRK